jgi:hypothetical protein
VTDLMTGCIARSQTGSEEGWMSMTGTAASAEQAERARQTIWRLFARGRVSANVATARLLSVDLAARGRADRRQDQSDGTARAAPAPETGRR